jgi:hypothetical protein
MSLQSEHPAASWLFFSCMRVLSRHRPLQAGDPVITAVAAARYPGASIESARNFPDYWMPRMRGA